MKKLTAITGALASLLFGGCAGLTNLTPENVPENASRTYTISMSAHINDGSVIQDSIKPSIVIDGEVIPMREAVDMKHERIYEYDYVMPKNRKEAKYYFLLDYDVENNVDGVSKHRQMTSRTVYVLRPTSRYVVSMQNERGPVGSQVPVLGRGFDRLDRIIVGDIYADTEFVSRTTLMFTVPPLQSGKNYDVNLVNTKGDETWVGQFRVDASTMNVSPASVDLKGGEICTMIFNIGFKAPKGGYPIDIKTNIPSSIIMEEVSVPEGKNSTAVTLKAAAPGKGVIYVNAVGFAEKQIPVNISEPDSADDTLRDATQAARKIDESIKGGEGNADGKNVDKNADKADKSAEKDGKDAAAQKPAAGADSDKPKNAAPAPEAEPVVEAINASEK